MQGVPQAEVALKRMLLAMGILVAGARATGAGEFVVRPGGENKVVFVSKATVEGFEGKTKQLEGRLALDPANLGDTVSVHLEVDLASLDTGIAKRNQHMRENHLETAKYPKAVFDGIAVHGPAGARLEPGKPDTLDIEGTFTLHGVSRRLRIQVQATYDPKPGGARIAFHTTFPVTLADYAISRPEFLFLKLAETQQVRVDGVAVAAP
jgi:polyisoprenoid-binding protein YceI